MTSDVAPTVTVVICAYTLDRWELLKRAVASAQAQELAPEQVLVCIDHNPELALRAGYEWARTPGVTVLTNRHPGRLGSSRNTAVAEATGDVIAFLDDDAEAPRTWLSKLAGAYAEMPEVMAIGGAPLPTYGAPRPGWLPPEFDWTFGCAYVGLPTRRAATRRLIGANMSVRRSAVLAVGGFHSDDHDDMDLCQRVGHRFGPASVVYDPTITISHYVSPERLTWRYFWRRCVFVNRGKVVALTDMDDAGKATADIVFALRALFVHAPQHAFSGSADGLQRALVTVAGVALAAFGRLLGRLELAAGRAEPSKTLGLGARDPASEPAT